MPCLKLGLSQGAYVGVMMDNHPDYLACLGAISRLGAVGVLINPGVRGDVLEHALAAGRGKLIVSENHLEGALDCVDKERLIVTGSNPANDSVASLEEMVRHTSDALEPHLVPNPGKPGDLALLMFTSGTTGLQGSENFESSVVYGSNGVRCGRGFEPRRHGLLYFATVSRHRPLLGAGGALVSGCRLALGLNFP